MVRVWFAASGVHGVCIEYVAYNVHKRATTGLHHVHHASTVLPGFSSTDIGMHAMVWVNRGSDRVCQLVGVILRIVTLHILVLKQLLLQLDDVRDVPAEGQVRP